MIEDFCQFFKQIEDNPTELIKGMTIRDYLGARLHIQTCDKCFESAKRVLERNRTDDGNDPIYISKN